MIKKWLHFPENNSRFCSWNLFLKAYVVWEMSPVLVQPFTFPKAVTVNTPTRDWKREKGRDWGWGRKEEREKDKFQM